MEFRIVSLAVSPLTPELAISMAPNTFLMSFFLLFSLKKQGKSGTSNNNLQE